MALLFFDGFDSSGATALVTKYSSSSAVNTDSTNQRTGNYCVWFTSASSFLVTKTLPASGGAIVGVAVRLPSYAADDILQIREGSTTHMTVALDTAGKLSVKRGTTTLATGTTVLTLSNWYYIELKTVIHDTTGSYELRIDTVTELSDAVEDTRNGGTTGQWDNIVINCAAVGTLVDDFYVCDTSGSTNNDFLGPVKVETLLPQTGNGTNTGLTPSTGTDHGALVDESPANTSDYNSSATVGVKDTYHYPSLSLTGAVLGIQTNLYVAKSDTAARTVCAVVRSGGTDYDGANVSPGTTFGYFSEVRATNPATGLAWTTADVNGMEAGMKVTA
jgi:hypothetical protein